ncbi:MBL fold metallo-hydrolase [Allosaccharopolyspora coralli]|uniref:MBL fold metallo-hydrolase n=1 Tax=Allosaccharopolyspora coralli TaxID=2665642 RepID=A0A5Q3Q590_9PSEU|nr:MBL fold metallo-hydrolase [Allosaccharopolyspora coralli]QGK69768.1 MBL fold metallo-hydrolase [Allosaccharopolyspora coralli]
MTTASPPRSYADRLSAPLPGFGDLMRLMWTGGFRANVADVHRIPVVRSGLPDAEPNTTALTWVGHASYVIRLGGATMLTDPVWSHRIPGVPRRLTPPGVGFDELPTVDGVLVSHNHYDHLDAPTIRRMPRGTPMLVPAGLGRWFRRRGFTDVRELDWWDSTEVAGHRVDFVPSHHWSRRSAWDACRSLWGGWVITGESGVRVYHAGDSGYGDRFAEIGERFPGIDVAMLPIGAYAPRWFMRSVHVDPPEAVRAMRDVGARRLATMHWGTFALSREPVLEPLDWVRQAWQEAGLPRRDLWDLAVGETRTLSDGD